METRERDPRSNPRPSDELCGNHFLYRVIKVWPRKGMVQYEMIGSGPRRLPQHSVSLSGWRDMAAGLIVEQIA